MDNVLITGAFGGIGKALCTVFHECGYRVVGVDKQECTEPLPYPVIKYDICQLKESQNERNDFRKKVSDILDGPLSVLINNAAVQVLRKVESLTAPDWDLTLDTNLLAPFWMTQLFLDDLRNTKGSVVNVASIHAKLTKAGFVAYATSKGALVSLTRSLALELAPEVRVNAVVPAATDTPMLRAGFDGDPKGLETLGSYHPMGRIAHPEEVAKAVKFLAGRESGFITGTALDVDGGIGGALHDPVVK